VRSGRSEQCLRKALAWGYVVRSNGSRLRRVGDLHFLGGVHPGLRCACPGLFSSGPTDGTCVEQMLAPSHGQRLERFQDRYTLSALLRGRRSLGSRRLECIPFGYGNPETAITAWKRGCAGVQLLSTGLSEIGEPWTGCRCRAQGRSEVEIHAMAAPWSWGGVEIDGLAAGGEARSRTAWVRARPSESPRAADGPRGA